MQALRRNCSGTRASKSAPKLASLHQHGGCLTPVARSTCPAHWLDWPHSGQQVGSIGEVTGMAGSIAGNFGRAAV